MKTNCVHNQHRVDWGNTKGSGHEYYHCKLKDLTLSQPIVAFFDVVDWVKNRKCGEVYTETGWWIFKQATQINIIEKEHPCDNCVQFSFCEVKT